MFPISDPNASVVMRQTEQNGHDSTDDDHDLGGGALPADQGRDGDDGGGGACSRHVFRLFGDG